MKERLTLEHWATYLPFELKLISKNEPQPWLLSGIEVNIQFPLEPTLKCKRHDYKNIIDIWSRNAKPILRPLSDFRKDEFFDLYMEFLEEMEMVNCKYLIEALESKTSYSLDILKYDKLEQFMYKNHFDWKYNLIEKELAVDINTVEI